MEAGRTVEGVTLRVGKVKLWNGDTAGIRQHNHGHALGVRANNTTAGRIKHFLGGIKNYLGGTIASNYLRRYNQHYQDVKCTQ